MQPGIGESQKGNFRRGANFQKEAITEWEVGFNRAVQCNGEGRVPGRCCIYPIIKILTRLTRLDSRHSFSYTFNYATSFMSKNNRKLSLRITPAKGVTVCVTHASSKDLDAYLTSLGWCHLNRFYGEWFTSLPCYCCTTRYSLRS